MWAWDSWGAPSHARVMTLKRAPAAMMLVLMLTVPLIGAIGPVEDDGFRAMDEGQWLHDDWTTEIPSHAPLVFTDAPWWTWTTMDADRDGIHDNLQAETGMVWVGLSYGTDVTESHLAELEGMGLEVVDVIEAVDAVLIGEVESSLLSNLSALTDVVMVERYGIVTFHGDVQTPAVKAINSTEYPESAWQLGVTGAGVNIALVDTGVDNEHPGLDGKFVAGYDAVCYVHSDPMCVLAGGRVEDGSFDPDDGNQHGTACMGMASATGLEADGSQSAFYGAAPNASLVDVRIGTDVGAGPFENYLIPQEFYESAMNGLQWIIDNRDTAWPGVDESLHGIDVISLSWGITSHESGGSDGTDMHSRILDEAMEAGVTVSNAAGNDGPDNDGLSGMSSSSLSITVGATDDQNTVDRADDTIAGYSSRGPRRDNGDGNPVNELKPEISAPGSNIIQAEGCVTSGLCSNLVNDASQNTYTGRGSGTSYATPAVTGVVALVMEANPDLSPVQIKEVLKQTAERRGPASAPSVDPYWNRDFGYGMVDARAAVELAFHLFETNQSEGIDPSLQNHLLNVTTEGGRVVITGHAWTQGGVMDRVEYRIGDGTWREATYEDVSELAPLTPFNWTVALSLSAFSGEETIEVRAVRGEMHSLPVTLEATGTGGVASSSMSLTVILGGAAAIVGLFAVLLAVLMLRQPAVQEEVFEAEILPESDDLSSLTVAELKARLQAAGLPVSGNKAELIARLETQTA